jgi:hypothetical protein
MLDFWWDILRKALWSSLGIIGQTPGGLLYGLFVIILAGVWIYRKKGLRGLKAHVAASATEFVTIVFLAWIPVFVFAFASEIHGKWKTEAETVTKLRVELGKRDKFIEWLEEKLNFRLGRKEVPWYPPIMKASHFPEGDNVRLEIFVARDSAHYVSTVDIKCEVTDPEFNSVEIPVGSGSVPHSITFNTWYPRNFKAAPLRAGTYKVRWLIATDDKQVIATDAFEIPGDQK